MIKVLGVVGSPRRRGNTHILVSKVLEGAKAQGAAAEILLLGDMEILECDGCHACWKGKGCRRDDDMTTIYPKIVESDVLILGTPVYWFGPTALMKGFMDRFVYFNCPENRAKIKGKKAAIAVPFEEERAEAADLVTAFFEKCCKYLEVDLVGRVLAPGVTRRGEIAKQEEKLAEACALGRKLAGGGGVTGRGLC